jgi:TRAP-type C4-dicarboxylate transport system substrate-binding protein
MSKANKLAFAAMPALGVLVAGALSLPAQAQTTLTYSSWAPPSHHLTVWQANWTQQVEKATGGRVKFSSLPKAPSCRRIHWKHFHKAANTRA